MKQAPLFPVTRDTLPSCWKSIDILRRKARRKAAISRICGFSSNLILLFCLLFVFNGLIYSQFHGTYHAFLEDLPWFVDAWEFLTGLVIKAGDSLKLQVLKLLLAAYGTTIAVFALMALLVTTLYHPKKKPVPTGDYPEQTALLAEAAQEARNYSYKTRLTTSFGAIILIIITALLLLIAYILHRNDYEASVALLCQFPTHNYEVNLIIYVYIGYVIGAFFCGVLLLLARPLYRYEFPYDYVVQAESAALFALEEDAESTSEKHAADAASLREEAIGLEKERAYEKAKAIYFKASLGGDVRAMEHYARHCLLDHRNDSARYWLARSVSPGQASREAKFMLLRIKLRMKHNVRYLSRIPHP